MWIMQALLWFSFAGYGQWIASIKRRRRAEGFLIGLILGPIGCVIEACIRERSIEACEKQQLRRSEEAKVLLEERQERSRARQADAARMREEAASRAAISKARRTASYQHLSAWFDRTILKFGWYKALPEVVQPMVVGLFISLPIVCVLILIFRRLLP
jgi:hypothetical protein